MNVGSISSAAPSDLHTQKLVRAAHQFEAILLNSLLGPLEQTFASLGQQSDDPMSNQYQFLGVQTLASCLADRGGLGIADMIIRNVTRHEESEVSKSQT